MGINSVTSVSRPLTTGSNYHMRRGLSLAMHIDQESISKFDRQVYGIISGIESGSRQLIEDAMETILYNSRSYIPRDTDTLLSSGYTIVRTTHGVSLKDLPSDSKNPRYRQSVKVYTGEVGYGDDNAAGRGVINPKTGLRPSQYAWKVHEDLTAKHPNGGQAKFLERAYREYVANYYGNELVELERLVVGSKRYRVTSFGGAYTTRLERVPDNNMDRLTEIYNMVARR